MRISFFAVSCLFASVAIAASAQSAPTCADLHLVPAPRECKAVKSIAIGSAGVRIVSARNSEDEFAAKDLEESLRDRDIAGERAGGSTVVLERVSKERAEKLFDKPDEAYMH